MIAGGLTIARISEVNRRRCARWHDPDTDAWTGADWSNAMVGEAGEVLEVIEALTHAVALGAAAGKAANTVKKLRRHETGTAGPLEPDRVTLHGALGHEIADTILYALLLADHYAIDVEEAIVEKFNLVSARQNFPERLP